MAERLSPHVTLHVIKEENIRALDEDQLEKLYCWIDRIPFSRPKRNVTRDFSDGVLAAEVLHNFLPRLIELHNYTSASSLKMKETNWYHLNRRVLQKIGLQVAPAVIQSIVACKPGVIESVLVVMRDNINLEMSRQRARRPQEELTVVPKKAANQRTNRREDRHSGSIGAGDYVPSSLENSPFSPRGQIAKYESVQSMRRLNHLNATETVPKGVLEERQKELEIKEENVQILLAKIERLEHLVHLKDLRIEELTTRVDDIDRYRQTRPHQLLPVGGRHLRPANQKTALPASQRTHY